MNIVGIRGSIKSSGYFKKMSINTGHTFRICTTEHQDTIDSADLFVQTNILRHHEGVQNTIDSFTAIKNSGKPSIVSESPIFRVLNDKAKSSRWYRLTLDSYYFNEGVYPTNMPDDRWRRIQHEYDITVKDWKESGDHILLNLQKITDSSLNNLYKKYNDKLSIVGFSKWLNDTLLEIRKYTDRKIIVRPHPNTLPDQLTYINNVISTVTNCELSSNIVYDMSTMLAPASDLETDIKNAHAVITFNSLTAVYSALEGKPTYVLDPSAVATPIARTDLSLLETEWTDIDRQPWLNNMAYVQWRSSEISEGKCWPILQSLIPNRL